MADTTAESFRDWARKERERRHTPAGLVLSQEEVVRFLVTVARVDQSGLSCEDENCPDCNVLRRTWWELCNALELRWYRVLRASLAETGTPFPEGPWDEVDA